MSKKSWGLIAVLIISHTMTFYLSLKYERYKNVIVFNEGIEKYEIDMMVMHYKKYRGIVLDIQKNKLEAAECRAELAASIMLLNIDYCKTSSFCTEYLESIDKQVSLELLGKVPLTFTVRNSCTYN